jgi:LIVCS family branched-chain amino acid:cation transporter
MKQKTKDILLTGSGIFTLLFGAGNLIFPPNLGLVSGKYWPLSFSSFIIDIMVAFLAIYIFNRFGSYHKVAEKIGQTFIKIYITVVMLVIMIFFIIPRTAAVSFEILQTPFTHINPLIFYIIYFLATIILAYKESKVFDNIGKVLGPLLIIAIFVIIIMGVFTLHPSYLTVTDSPTTIFAKGLSGGYETADSLGAFLQGGLAIAILKSKGYAFKERQSILKGAALIFIALNLIFYLGFFYLGACIGGLVSKDLSTTQVLFSLMQTIIGAGGSTVFAIIIFFICFTTAVGATGMVAAYFDEEYKFKYSYGVLITALIGIGISLLGVDKILIIFLPIFKLACPILIILLFLHLFKIQSRRVFEVTIYIAIIFTLIEIFALNFHFHFLMGIVNFIPFSSLGFIWFVPCLIGFLISFMIATRRITTKD